MQEPACCQRCLLLIWLSLAGTFEARAETIVWSCDITRLIVATGKTSSTRRFLLQVELDDKQGRLKFDDEARWGALQIDVLGPDRIRGSNGPLQFSLDRRSGRLTRSLGGGGRQLLDTGVCSIEKG